MLNISLTSYLDACGVMATAKTPSKGKPLATSTRLHKRGEDFAVQYHDTDIVTFRPDGKIVLNTGGWLTMMTRQRMEEYLPTGWAITSIKGRWYLVQRGDTWATPRARYAFRDGITLDHGIVTGYESDDVVAVQDKENRATDKAVKAYVAGITAEVVTEGFEHQGGDCFGCLAPEAFGLPHLALHIEESYYPLNLLANALADKGYRPEVYLSMAARGDDFGLRTVRKVVAGYLRNALYTGAVAVAHGRKPVGARKVSWQQSA